MCHEPLDLLVVYCFLEYYLLFSYENGVRVRDGNGILFGFWCFGKMGVVFCDGFQLKCVTKKI